MHLRQHKFIAVIQNTVSVAIEVSVTIGKIRINAKIPFHIATKTRFVQLKNFSNAAVSSRISHILNHWFVALIGHLSRKGLRGNLFLGGGVWRGGGTTSKCLSGPEPQTFLMIGGLNATSPSFG